MIIAREFPESTCLLDNTIVCSMTLSVSDCCDGSDEYESSIRCPNTCIMGGNVNYIYKPRTDRISIDRQLGSSMTDLKELKTIVNLQDMVKNLQGFATFLCKC